MAERSFGSLIDPLGYTAIPAAAVQQLPIKANVTVTTNTLLADVVARLDSVLSVLPNLIVAQDVPRDTLTVLRAQLLLLADRLGAKDEPAAYIAAAERMG